MKLLSNIFGIIGVFLIPVGVVYGFMTDFTEWAGFPAILATAVMCLFLWWFLSFTDKKHPDMPYEDLDGEIADQAGAYGFYSPWSWWPLVIGIVCTIAVVGLAVAWWVLLLALPVAIAALVGWVYEYNRGAHSH
ncbi:MULTISPECIES: cytochrome c oxidase subunit 4 [unclassified Rothia (in: high G+C Gram-positive bacteria)]|uniref:cytochrome c oxidase subunit 4 n=1 Tax=unclassified Rothia (in: high G+C Gram-positive bacteria) TaxID=2689056 RepID=UPI0019594655|nr:MULTISPECIES: cytochrome c oxidase subunit 4 [unclassified Rothia (in: high G+C Gram-positive bacteria)]MBM7050542.1 cytochrome c oxidase subunit 4 [Rothia sp. ZJ1223]QRZ60735.1 cytochrome c oxidase subunit 4 [Rothia sp. ZJ932]